MIRLLVSLKRHHAYSGIRLSTFRFFYMMWFLSTTCLHALNIEPKFSSSGRVRRPRSSPSKRSYKRLEEYENIPKNILPISLITQGLRNQQRKNQHNQDAKKAYKRGKVVCNVHELRNAILDERTELKNIQLNPSFADVAVKDLLNHHVLQIITERFHSQSTPGNRRDNATLALAIEGGGMRGCVSAGMAAAIACLGLCDVFDTVYGSSAGSVTGAYIVSRQVCLDIYLNILPAAKKQFVCITRLVRALMANFLDLVSSGLSNSQMKKPELLYKNKFHTAPGMNISFVLDGIMGESHGLRPLDLNQFKVNNEKQPLRIAASCVDRGLMYSKCFGTEDFYNTTSSAAMSRADGTRSGLFACLEASMTVPGATGPPVNMAPHESDEVPVPFFDAFCFEPLPYRSAVADGASHVLVLCSRPEGFEPKTNPGVYEKGVAPLYFHSHGQPEVANFFERGGQQYLYAEDLLTLEDGKLCADSAGVLVPPPKILYGSSSYDVSSSEALIARRNELWNRAHLLPLKVPRGTSELSTLEQDEDAVLAAVRSGFSAAFDLLAPAIGLQIDIDGKQAAELVFPEGKSETISTPVDKLLQTKVQVMGDAIIDEDDVKHMLDASRSRIRPTFSRKPECSGCLATTLLNTLPGLRGGKLRHFAKGLQTSRVI